MIIIGLVIFSASQLWFGMATQEWMLYVARFISGIGGAFLIPATMAFVADITTLKNVVKAWDSLVLLCHLAL